jgi:O-antigen/teichoic acid export membrane protein
MSDSTVKQISLFTISRYLAEGLFALRGFFLASLLSPLTFAIWTQMRLVLTFLQFIRLGTNEALVRDYPYHKGRGSQETAHKIADVVSGFNLLMAAAAILIVSLYFLLGQSITSLPEKHLWYLWLLLFFLNQIYWFFQCKLQATQQFIKVGQMIVGFSLLSTAGGLLCAYLYGFVGFLIALIFSYLVMILYASGADPREFKPSWDTVSALKLIRTGFPIMASGALFILLLNVDKIIIWIFMQRQDLGIYAIQSYITNFIMLAPGAVAMVLFPSMMEQVGKSNSNESVENYLTHPTLILAYYACPVLAALFFLLPLPIQWLLPQYAPAIQPGQILILASFFVIASRMPFAIMVSLNKQNRLMLISLVAVLFTATADWLLLKSGFGISGVAAGSALGFTLYASATISFAFRYLRLSTKKLFKFFLTLIAPFLMMIAGIVVLDRIFPSNCTTWYADMTHAVIRVVMFLIPSGFLLFLCSHRLRFLNIAALVKKGT